jgi:hypothetical protein
MRFNIYTYYSSKQLWQVSFNLSDETFVEISEPVVTDEEKAGFAKDVLTEQLAKKYIYTETVTLPAEDANFDAVYSYVVKEGDEDKMEIANGKLTFSEVSELTTATLVVTITVGEYTTTAEIPVEIAPIEPMTIAEVLAKAKDEDIVVAGRVVALWDTKYYNFYIVDEAGDKIFVYGNRTVVALGDRVVIKGKKDIYNGCPQVGSWTLISREAGTPELPPIDGTITIAELVALRMSGTNNPFNKYLQVYAKRVGNYLVDVDNPDLKVLVYKDTARLPAEGTIGTFNVYFYGFANEETQRLVYVGLEGEYTAPQLTDEEKVAADKALLEEMRGDVISGSTLTLPTTGVNGSTITWVADPADLIDENGVVGAGLTADATLTLTATLTLGEVTDEVVITINVITQVQYDTVAEARAVATNSEVKVKGVVTSLIGNNAFIQDETGGIYLYLASDGSYADQLVIGNEVGVIGIKDVYKGLHQVKTVTHVEVIGTKPVPTPTEFTSLAGIIDKEGQLVTVRNVTIKSIPSNMSGSFNVVITDGTNDIQVRVDKNIAAFNEVKEFFETLVAGQPIEFVAVPVGRYNATPQLMVSSVSQMVVEEMSDAEKLAADVDAQPTNLGTKTDVFTLPTQGAQGSTITWTVKSGTAVVIVDNVVTEVIRPAADGEDAEVVLEATFTLGEEEPVTVEVTVTIAKEAEAGGDPVTVTAAYSGDTTNMTDGNNASTIGLNPDLFTVTAIKNSPNQNVGLNKDGQIRIYTDRNDGNGNILQISIAAGFKITSVVFEFGASTNNPTGKLTLGENVYDLSTADLRNVTKKYSDLDITTFSLQNTQTGGSKNAQIYILSITITYVPVN